MTATITERFAALQVVNPKKGRPLARFCFMLGALAAHQGAALSGNPFPNRPGNTKRRDPERWNAVSVARMSWRAGWYAFHKLSPGVDTP